MSDEHTDPELQEWIDPELEARVVAWVLGQASGFEGAELERILAEKPELAIFKRRIEAVHGLVRAASLPEGEPMRLSAERRQKVLDTLGQKELPPLTQVVAMAPAKKRGGNPWSEFAGVAACLVVAVILLASIATPSFTGVQIKAEQTKILALKRQRELQERIEAEDREADQAAQPQQQAPHIANPVAQPAAQFAALDALKKMAEQRLSQSQSQNLPDSARNQLFAGNTRAMGGAAQDMVPAGPVFLDGSVAPAGAFSRLQSKAKDDVEKDLELARQRLVEAGPAGPGATTHYRSQTISAAAAPTGFAQNSGGMPAEAAGAGENLSQGDLRPLPEADFTATGADVRREAPAAKSDTMSQEPPPTGSAGDVEEVKRLFTEAKDYEQTGRYDQSYRDQYASQAYVETRSQLQWQLDKGWQMPVQKFGAKGAENFVPTQANVRHTEYIARKLDRIIIPKIEFRDATLSEAVDFLKEKSRDLDTKEPDPARHGVNIVLENQAGGSAPAPEAAAAPVGPAAPAIPGLEPMPATGSNAAPAIPALAAAPVVSSGEPRITLSLSNIPLMEALRYICELSQMKLKIDPYAVSIVPLSVNTDELITKEYTVPPGFMAAAPTLNGANALNRVAGGGAEDASAAGANLPQRQTAIDFLSSQGVHFPPGASAVYFPGSNRLIVHNTESNLGLVDAITEPAGVEPPSVQEIKAQDQPYSTFSLHVSDVSFLLAQAALARGQLPDPESIRPEEFYNAFDYGDPSPVAGQQVACHIEQAVHPLVQQRNLVRIAVKIAASGRGAGQPLRLTVLLDTSGSMEREDRAASVRRAMQSLASLLGPQDSVTLIGFAREPRILAEAVPGDQAKRLADIVAHTPADGGTNMEEALKSATQLALRHFDPKGQNRVVLLTDGAANLGDADPGQLSKLVESLRQRGVSFDACGVGANGLNDEILEALTRKGGGRYYFLNGPDDADQGFARKLAGAFRPAAEDVKMQVRFNPSRVGVYRLIGFEKQRLNQEDFRNNKVTAAQLASEEAAVALYEVQPLPEGEGELGEVFVRFRDPSNGRIVEQSWTIPYDSHAPALDKAPPSMQLAAAASFVAEKLRGGDAAGAIDLNALEPVIAQVRANFPDQPRVRQFVDMFEQVRGMMPGTKAGNSR